MTTIQTPEQATAAQLAQLAAELAYACGISEDRAVCTYDSPAYTAADQVFRTLVVQAYDLDAEEYAQVRELLAELGPHEGARGTDGYGVASFVQYARREVAERAVDRAERATWDAHAPQGSMSDQHEWAAYRAGLDGPVATAWLSDSQLGPFLRELGPGWSVQLDGTHETYATYASARGFTASPSPSYLASCDAELAARTATYRDRLSERERTITLTALAADKLADALYIRLGGYANGALYVQAQDDRSVTITLAS